MRFFHAGKWRECRSVEFRDGKVILIDQRSLPFKTGFVECRTFEQAAEAISNMTVRGAPAIGVTAAYGFAIGMRGAKGGKKDVEKRAAKVFDVLAKARPTAINLRNALERVRKSIEHARTAEEAMRVALETARRFDEENLAACRMIGVNGARAVPKNARILTICNTGPLASVDHGTAFAVIDEANRQKKLKLAYACETRPRAQGALTAWEMDNARIPHKVIADGAAGDLMRRREIDFVVVGADRIAQNGDFANKLGTYSLAVLAHENGVPFYVAAPMSTFDRSIQNGAQIPVEERSEDEVLFFRGQRVYPEGTKALNRAFDVTPHRYVKGIITEVGIIEAGVERHG